MLKFRLGLITLLIGCVTFISCGELLELLTPPEEDMPEEEMMPTDDMLVGLPMYISMYTAWTTNVAYPVPKAPVKYTARGAGPSTSTRSEPRRCRMKA